MLWSDHLCHFLWHESLADNIVTFPEMELHRLLIEFSDRAIYYAIVGYDEEVQCVPKDDLERVRFLRPRSV